MNGSHLALAPLLAVILGLAAGFSPAAEPAVNEWTKVSENGLGPGFSPGLVWSPEQKRFVFLKRLEEQKRNSRMMQDQQTVMSIHTRCSVVKGKYHYILLKNLIYKKR